MSLQIFILALIITFFVIFLINFSDFIQSRNLHNKFIYFGYEDAPTKFIYNEKEIIIYKKREYLENKISNYHSFLFIDTLYINNIPVIGIECFERLCHIQRDVDYNFDYDQKEIELIIKQGIEEWHKQFKNKESHKKSILKKEN